MALALSSALHAGIIFLTTAGQGAKIQGRPFSQELQVSLIQTQPLAEIAQPVQATPSQQPEAQAISNDTTLSEADGIIPLSEQRYYKAGELDVIPQPTSLIRPSYPDTAPSSIRQGIVKLELKLNEEGVVTDAAVVSSEPPGYFEEAARQAFLHAQFTPGIKSGQKVRSRLILKVYFESPRIYNSPD